MRGLAPCMLRIDASRHVVERNEVELESDRGTATY